MSNIYLPICAFLISFLITIVYFNKKRIKNLETKIYGYLLIINILESLVACTVLSLAIMYGTPSIILLLNRIDFILIITWCSFLFKYIHYLIYNVDNRKANIFIIVFNVIGYFLSITTGMNLVNENGVMNCTGMAPTVVFIVAGIYVILMILYLAISILKNKNNLHNKKYYPIYSLIFLSVCMLIIRQIMPELTLLSFIIMYVNLIMYFTIENPDVKMIEQLNIAKDTAEKANRAKSDFLSSMSHEIRTPLNAIVGFSDCIINANSLEEAKDNAKDVITASNTLLEIVNGILDISKIEAGKLELVENDYDIKKLLNDVIKLIRVRIGDKPLEFKVNIAEDLPQVLYGDHTNVKKIMINLLTNAVKYTDQGCISLDVKCVKTNQICRLIVSVKDTGRGIKKEDIAKLFTKFQRVDEDRNTTIEGTGLGLAITKQLVQMMNGNIVVNSVYGEGSEFTVAIDQRLSLAKLEPEKEENVNTNLDLTGKKILIVDDNKLNIKVAEKILIKYNPTIDSCESGLECLEKVKLNNYDLILLDDMMPKMKGSEVLIKLKENPNFNTPVIVLTANAINGMEEQYLSKGFNGYLAKPIEKDKLFYILNKYLGNNKNNISNIEDKTAAVTTNNNFNRKDINYLKEKGININSSLELLGDVSTYNEILKEYVNGINEKITNLTNFKNNNDMENYAILVHSLKSESRYLGFDKLADICLQHELKSKENNTIYVQNNFDILLTELNNILEIVKQYLN